MINDWWLYQVTIGIGWRLWRSENVWLGIESNNVIGAFWNTQNLSQYLDLRDNKKYQHSLFTWKLQFLLNMIQVNQKCPRLIVLLVFWTRRGDFDSIPWPVHCSFWHWLVFRWVISVTPPQVVINTSSLSLIKRYNQWSTADKCFIPGFKNIIV